MGNRGQVEKVHAQHRHHVFMADSKAEARTLRSATLALGWELQKEQILYKVSSVALTHFKGKHTSTMDCPALTMELFHSIFSLYLLSGQLKLFCHIFSSY